jgi:Concanavalin A-like lectin/glucanases superfamily
MAAFQEYPKQMMEQVQNINPQQMGQEIGSSIARTGENVANYASEVQSSVSNQLSQFASSFNVGTASQEFLNSNSIIARFVFIILVLIVFLFVFDLGIKLIGYFTQYSNTPYVVYGMLDGNSNLVISQDPGNSSGVFIPRSNNQPTGLEFTWSIWVLPTAFTARTPTYRNVFNKGGARYNTDGVAFMGNSPGVYLTQDAKYNTNLHIVMDDGTSSPQTLDISGIPVNKWVHIALRMQNKVMDVYVNGTIAGRSIMKSVPIQNYYDINIGQNGGFNGKLSNLQYYDYALPAFTINNIVLAGPNTSTSLLSTTTKTTNATYLSNLWYASKLN